MSAKENPLIKVGQLGQSIWLDFLRRGMMETGELSKLIEGDGLRGMTSNPSIFEKAITGSHDYDEAIRLLALENRSAADIYRSLTVEDVQAATDLFRPLYDRTKGRDGFVSLEVSPHLAHDTKGTVAEARSLWAAVDRPNVMIKVPATPEGLPAIQQLIGEGINVNITLLFGLPRYHQVAEAYLSGLERLASQGKSLERIASVASFFLSRIDVLVDPMLEKVSASGGIQAGIASRLLGQVAVASARIAYQIYEDVYSSQRFQQLVAGGARPQRLLWASTSTKNPNYSDVKYVEPLIGPETVNTMTLETLNAYRDHGRPAVRLEENLDDARQVLDGLKEVGIDLDHVTQQLEDEGVEKFNQPFDRLMDALQKARTNALEEPLDRQSFALGEYADEVETQIKTLGQEHFSHGLWSRDPSLWKTDPKAENQIRNSLGWLHVAEKMVENLSDLSSFVNEVKADGFQHVVHMGMGGSSLAPLVLEKTASQKNGGLPLSVLDTTDPATILQLEKSLPLEKTLFIVASKSGTTAEPLAFADYFYAKLQDKLGKWAGDNFVAITDPNTPLVEMAKQRSYRRIFYNFADIGGRYSALSYFGLLPSALTGLDVAELLERALRMEHACASFVAASKNPGISLGAALGLLAKRGLNKVTFLTPQSIAPFGMWLEQLLAESTGKEGTGLLPVAGEPLGSPAVYGDDRVFVYLRLAEEVDQKLEKGTQALRDAGHPLITIRMDDHLDLGQEFFRWEIATATAGALLGINAFDQPNVQESKDNTNHLLDVETRKGGLPELDPLLVEGPLRLYFPETASTAAETLSRFLSRAQPGNYFALLAYLTESPYSEKSLQNIRLQVRDRFKLATTVGYGPRFLHSTGQFHKGGPNTGLFLQITADNKEDAPIPGAAYTFGELKQAQAAGDFQALQKHKRQVGRIHLSGGIDQGLEALQSAMRKALGH